MLLGGEIALEFLHRLDGVTRGLVSERGRPTARRESQREIDLKMLYH
jgi:hypothetical protein